MTYSGITGDLIGMNLDFDEMKQAGRDLLQLVREWRERLCINCGVLDDYLAGILAAMTETSDIRATAEAGFENALSELRRVLQHIKRGNEFEAQKHPFYPQIREYMDNNPLPQDVLYYEAHCVGLFPEYLFFATRNHMASCETKFQAALEEHNIPQLREDLLILGITADELEHLHTLISWLFVLVTPSVAFMQGMVDQIMMSLLCCDENGRRLFQRLVDDF